MYMYYLRGSCCPFPTCDVTHVTGFPPRGIKEVGPMTGFCCWPTALVPMNRLPQPSSPFFGWLPHPPTHTPTHPHTHTHTHTHTHVSPSFSLVLTYIFHSSSHGGLILLLAFLPQARSGPCQQRQVAAFTVQRTYFRHVKTYVNLRRFFYNSLFFTFVYVTLSLHRPNVIHACFGSTAVAQMGLENFILAFATSSSRPWRSSSIVNVFREWERREWNKNMPKATQRTSSLSLTLHLLVEILLASLL